MKKSILQKIHHSTTKFLEKIFYSKRTEIEEDSEAEKSLTKKKNKNAKEERKMRENLTESQINKTSKDSFPASDSPSTY